jgi:protein-S-isoprenylcysteine O-methyltransferase Ste14
MQSSPIIAHLTSFLMPLTAVVIVPAVLVERAGWPPSFAATGPLRLVAGALLIGAGLIMLAWTVSLFVRVGRGTLAPWDPTRRLVVLGPYAHVRNPMISGVLGIIVGEAVALGGFRLATWAATFFVVNHVYFALSEEPGLAERFGAEYEIYKRHVPRWIPRLRPWQPSP